MKQRKIFGLQAEGLVLVKKVKMVEWLILVKMVKKVKMVEQLGSEKVKKLESGNENH